MPGFNLRNACCTSTGLEHNVLDLPFQSSMAHLDLRKQTAGFAVAGGLRPPGQICFTIKLYFMLEFSKSSI